jgi:hypothetical protein
LFAEKQFLAALGELDTVAAHVVEGDTLRERCGQWLAADSLEDFSPVIVLVAK